MHLIGMGSYGSGLLSTLWLNRARRAYIEALGVTSWVAVESSSVDVQTHRLLQLALAEHAKIEIYTENQEINFGEQTHIFLNLGGKNANRLLAEISQGRLPTASICGLMPFKFDKMYRQAVSAAEKLRLWEQADPNRALTIVDPERLTQTSIGMVEVLSKIEALMIGGICEQVANSSRCIQP